MTTTPPSVDLDGSAGDDRLVAGEAVVLTPLIRRVLAPNPSVMTGPGTNTYLIGHDDVTVIDPGPDSAEHVATILAAARVDGGRLTRIICTHTHIDHWPGAVTLAEATGAPVLAYGSRDGLEVTGTLGEGDEIVTAEYTLRVLHTPGHASNHLCVLLTGEQVLFTGDHLMQGVTVVIAPPDGDMGAYVTSLQRLTRLEPALAKIAPAHGHLVDDPAALIDAYLAHRAGREAIVANALAGRSGPATVDELVPEVYADVDAAVYPIARLSLWAHLRKLEEERRADVVGDRDDVDSARWRAVTG